MTIPTRLLDILVCPQCRGGLRYREEVEALDCDSCLLRFRIESDIPVMLLDEAEPLKPGPGSP